MRNVANALILSVYYFFLRFHLFIFREGKGVINRGCYSFPVSGHEEVAQEMLS